MKVTERMLDLAVEGWKQTQSCALRFMLKDALTAALVDVPESLQHRLRAEAYEELSQAQFRIAELEEKLAKVREAVEDASMDDAEARLFVAGALDERVAILDDEDKP